VGAGSYCLATPKRMTLCAPKATTAKTGRTAAAESESAEEWGRTRPHYTTHPMHHKESAKWEGEGRGSGDWLLDDTVVVAATRGSRRRNRLAARQQRLHQTNAQTDDR
jgi:hypothetical protein